MVNTKSRRTQKKKPMLFLSMLGVLLFFLMVIILVSLSWLKQDRAELATRFSNDRLAALTHVASQVEDDIEDITDDLMLAARLVNTVFSEEVRRNELEAILSVGRAYQAFIMTGVDGEIELFLADPRRGGPPQALIMPVAEDTISAVRNTDVDAIEISPVLNYSERALRVFTKKINLEDPHTNISTLSLVVDMNHYIDPFQIIATDEHTHLVILGPHGEPAALSSGVVVTALEKDFRNKKNAPQVFREVVQKMRKGQKGTTRIDNREAERLGFGNAHVIAAYAPMRLGDTHHWSVATFTSMSVLKEHERAVITRLSVVSLAVALMLVLVSAYMVVSSHKKSVLQERIRYLDALARVNEKAKKTLDAIPIDVVTVSTDGRVTDKNHAFLSRENLKNTQNIHDIFAPTSNGEAEIEVLIERALDAKESRSIIGVKMKLLGQEGHFSVHAVPLAPESTEASVLLVIEDLTEIKRLESNLLTAEKLATVGVLAAGIAHEVGTPLGVVRGRAEYMMEKLTADNPMTSGLKTIVEQIDRVVRTIRHLLDYSRPQPVNKTAIDVSALLEKCSVLLKFEAERKKVQLKIEFDPELSRIAADSDQMDQVLVNLIMNAMDACEPGGRVTVSASLLSRQEMNTSGSRFVKLVVSDDGCGIPEENKARIFDPFFTTKKIGSSTGLGLTMVSQVVRSHNAQIFVSSAVGKGTVVVLLWPSEERSEHEQ